VKRFSDQKHAKAERILHGKRDPMMDSFEFSKIAAAVLLALLVIVGSRTYIHSLHPHYEESAGYQLPAPPPEEAKPAAGAAAAKAPEFNPAEIVAKIASAKPDAGKQAFGKCLACHTADASAASKAGPNLWNVVNRKLGAREDFKGYSDQMKAKGGEWTYEHLAGFLHSPKTYLPGTKMGFAGVSKPQELADIIAYIRTLADSPAPLPN
jgi:cytochrome c